MRRAALLITMMSIAMACSTATDASEPAATKQCEALRDHIVDLRLWEATGVDREAHREAMRDALGQEFVDGCTKTLTENQVDCGIKATDVAAATACTTTH